MAQKKRKTGLVIFGVGCGCIFFIILIAAGIYLYAGWLGYQEAPKLVESVETNVLLEDPYQLSSEQEEKLFTHGYPEAFTILFYEEEVLGGGIQTVRLEVWDYYTQRIGLTFINGELEAEEPLDPGEIGSIDPMPNFPEQFSAFMSLAEVTSAAGIDSYIEIPLEKEFMQDGVLYYANSLSFGLKDNELIYIEALATSSD
jgi:hypothetical protein